MELDKTHYMRPFYRSYYFFISLEITTNYVLKVVIINSRNAFSGD